MSSFKVGATAPPQGRSGKQPHPKEGKGRQQNPKGGLPPPPFFSLLISLPCSVFVLCRGSPPCGLPNRISTTKKLPISNTLLALFITVFAYFFWFLIFFIFPYFHVLSFFIVVCFHCFVVYHIHFSICSCFHLFKKSCFVECFLSFF